MFPGKHDHEDDDEYDDDYGSEYDEEDVNDKKTTLDCPFEECLAGLT